MQCWRLALALLDVLLHFDKAFHDHDVCRDVGDGERDSKLFQR